MATTTPRMKITYATLSADNEELQSAFDDALTEARAELGRSYPMIIGSEERTHSVTLAIEATHRRTGWWLRNDFKIKVVHARIDLHDEATAFELLPLLYGDRGRAYLMGPHRPSLELKLGLFHRARE